MKNLKRFNEIVVGYYSKKPCLEDNGMTYIPKYNISVRLSDKSLVEEYNAFAKEGLLVVEYIEIHEDYARMKMQLTQKGIDFVEFCEL